MSARPSSRAFFPSSSSAVWLLTVAVARLIGWRGPAQHGLLVATLFSNAGNVGLPLVFFAFGPAGLTIAENGLVRA